jgi:type IV pilus assembly protein PilM
MAKRLSGVLGIDIGSRKIKVAELKTQGKGPVITALGMIDTPEGAVDHTGVYNAEAVGLALKQVLSQAGTTVNHAVVSIAGQASVLVRTLEVPRMSDSELNDHMQWEINRNIPFAESNVQSHYKQLEDEDPNSTNIEVVMAISPQSAIDTMIACIKKAGKQIAAIDVQALSIARSLKISYDEHHFGKTVCVVDVGHLTTSINIYRNGRLLLPRQVPVGGEMFTKAIADAMGVGTEEAELLKQQKCHVHADLLQQAPEPFSFGASTAPTAAPVTGMTQEFQPYNPFAEDPLPAPTAPAEEMTPYNPFSEDPQPAAGQPPTSAEPEPAAAPYDAYGGQSAPIPTPITAGDPEIQKINESVAPVLEEFVAEVRRSLDYFRSKAGNVDHIELGGGAGKLAGLAETLSTSLGVPCDLYDPFKGISVTGKRIEPDFVDEHRPDFLVAVGNGLHIFFD